MSEKAEKGKWGAGSLSKLQGVRKWEPGKKRKILRSETGDYKLDFLLNVI